MDGWMDGWIDGWMGMDGDGCGCMDAWMHRCIDAWTPMTSKRKFKKHTEAHVFVGTRVPYRTLTHGLGLMSDRNETKLNVDAL